MAKNKIIIVLSIAVVLLILFIIGMFVIKPAIVRHNNKMVNLGVEYAVISLMQQAVTCEMVPLTFENQTINLIAVECLQQQAEVQEDGE